MHGTGTDTLDVKNWAYDNAYAEPEPLGIYKNNFGYGLSHGCIRLENEVNRSIVESKKITVGSKIICYDDSAMKLTLEDAYTHKRLRFIARGSAE